MEALPVATDVFAQIGDVELQGACSRHGAIDIAVAEGCEDGDALAAIRHIDGEGIGLVASRLALGGEGAALHHQSARFADALLGYLGGAEVYSGASQHQVALELEQVACSHVELSVAIDDEVAFALEGGGVGAVLQGERGVVDAEFGVAEQACRAVGGGVRTSIDVGAAVHHPVLGKLLRSAQGRGLAAIGDGVEAQLAAVQHGGPGVGVLGEEGQRAASCLVERCRAADAALSLNGHVGLAAHHHGLLLHLRVEGDGLVGLGSDEPVAFVVAHKGVAVDDVGLLGTCLGFEHVGIVRVVVAVEGQHTYFVGGGWCQPMVDGTLLHVGSRAHHFVEGSILLHLHAKALLVVGVVGPAERHRRGGRGLQGEQQGRTQEILSAVEVNAVDVVLDVGISVAGDGHGIVGGGVGAVLLFPLVGHAVAVGVGWLLSFPHVPGCGDAVGQRVLVADERPSLTIRQHLAGHVAVGIVAIGQRGSHGGQIGVEQGAAVEQLQGGVVVGLRLASGCVIVGYHLGVKVSVAVAVLPVVVGIAMEIAVATREGCATHGWAVDEQVRLDVDVGFALGVSSHDVGAVLPVVHDVVGILVGALDFEVACGVVAEQVAYQRHVVGLHQSACRVVHQPLPHNAILQGDVLWCGAFAVGVDAEGLVAPPGKRAMVENHVRAVGDAGAVLARVAAHAHAEAHVAHDDIGGSREADAVAIDGDALAGCRLPSHIEVVLEHHAALDVDDARHVEDDDAVGLADGIAKRAAAAIVQVGDVIHAAAAPSGGKAPPALGTREGQLLGIGREEG